ncbi:MAG: glycosyltransferase [Deltaproteobacteria bacterium]|nr:glycosyltransferase [Deltaproteobacteria bacterium]
MGTTRAHNTLQRSKGERALFSRNMMLLKAMDRDLWERVEGCSLPQEYEMVPSRSSLPTIKIGGAPLHSTYDPVGEGKKWAEYNLDRWDGFSTPLIFGCGLGYHVTELASLLDRDIVVIEPDLALFKLALHTIDLSSMLEQVSFLVAPDDDEIRTLLRGDSFSLMVHATSARLHPEALKWLETRLRLSERFRIVVVGPIYGGSLPIARYVSTALTNMGYEVEFIDCSLFKESFSSIKGFTSSDIHEDKLKGLFTTFLSELVMAKVVDFKPDLVFALAQAPLTPDLLKRLRENGIPSAMWFVEDFRVLEYWREIAPLYDYFFTIQDGPFFDALAATGVKNVYYLPLAAAPDIHKPLTLSEDEEVEYGSDISFVGAGYYNRRKFFLNLIDYDIKIWGDGWEGAAPLYSRIARQGTRISTEESVKVFNASRINLNLHSSQRYEGVSPDGDFVNPRCFELAACGAFQLTDYRSHLPRFFKEGSEVVCYRDSEDLRKKINYYREHPDEREAIAKRGRERVLRDHTYVARMEEMMEFLINRGFEGSAFLPGRSMVADLLNEAGRETELSAYLARYRDRRSIELSSIVKDIGVGRGDLTRCERVFLAMNEIMDKAG